MTYFATPGSLRSAAASNLQAMAEIEELRRELRQQQKQQIIIQNMPAPPTNPMREIIREIHQVQQPAPPPVAPQPSEETARLIAALNQAVANNQNLSAFAERMGMNMNQLVALMRAQLQAGGGGGEVAASSSSGPPPPPPGGYGPVAAAKRRPEVYQLNRPGRDPSRPPRGGEAVVAQPAQVETAPARSRSTASVREPGPPPRLERSRSEVRGAAASEIVPSRAPVRPSQAPVRPSAASRESTVSSLDSQRTIDYRGKEPAPPSREASRATGTRAASTASTIDYRSRSRGAGGSAPEPPQASSYTLPIKGGVTRGRSPPAQPERLKRIMEDIASSQNKELVKGQMRVELGRFARSFAAKRKEQEKRAVSQPLPPKAALTRTFDELVEEEVQPAPGARSVKQRIASRGGSQSGGSSFAAAQSASRVRSLTARGEGIRAA